LLEELEGVLRECTVHLGEHLGGREGLRGKKVERQAASSLRGRQLEGREAGRQLALYIGRWI
jgi:hypothetical protein